MAKILVTGGAGFIGSHLCEYLLKQDHEVICLDNLFTGSIENIKHLFKNKNFRFIQQDITEPFFLQVDQIYNLACPAAPIHYQFDPVKTIRTNVLGVINVLELAKKTGARVLQASTSEIYGDPKEHPQKESYFGNVSPISPRACYDEGKRCAETIFMDYYRQYGLEIKIVRIFNTYGPRMALNDGRVISNFIIQSLRGENLTIYGDGKQTRSCMYIDDLVEALVKMMASQKEFIGPVNLGNPIETTVKEIAEKIISLTNSKSGYSFFPLPEADPKQRQPDIALAKEKLAWQPKISLEEGFKKTLEYFQKRDILPKRRVLIFSTTYDPFIKEAEVAVKEITRRLKDYEFDLITAKLDKGLKNSEEIEGVKIHRLGYGSKIDKYLLPWFGFLKAMSLQRNKSYDLIWVVMASYAGFAGILFKLFNPKVKYFLSLHEKNTDLDVVKKTWFIYPFYKLIFKKADFIQAIDLSLERRARRYGHKAQSMIISETMDGSFYDKISLKIRNIFQRLI